LRHRLREFKRQIDREFEWELDRTFENKFDCTFEKSCISIQEQALPFVHFKVSACVFVEFDMKKFKSEFEDSRVLEFMVSVCI